MCLGSRTWHMLSPMCVSGCDLIAAM
jgi:hypothetical protein